MKYWEIIANDFHDSGWSSGRVSALNLEGRTVWIVDAHGYGNVSLCVRMKTQCVPAVRFIEYDALSRAKLPNHQGAIRAAPNDGDRSYQPDRRN